MTSKEINELYTRLRDLETRLKARREAAARDRARLDRLHSHLVPNLSDRVKGLEEAVDLINFALRKAGILEG